MSKVQEHQSGVVQGPHLSYMSQMDVYALRCTDCGWDEEDSHINFMREQRLRAEIEECFRQERKHWKR